MAFEQSTKAGRESARPFNLLDFETSETTIKLEKRLYEETNKKDHTCNREIKPNALSRRYPDEEENIKPEHARKNGPFAYNKQNMNPYREQTYHVIKVDNKNP